MASGQQVAEENVQRFQTWVASKTDSDFRQMVSRGVLSRTEIAAECGFAKSALAQNPRIREALKCLEEQLRGRGVLPPLAHGAEGEGAPVATQRVDSARAALDAERLSRVEQEATINKVVSLGVFVVRRRGKCGCYTQNLGRAMA